MKIVLLTMEYPPDYGGVGNYYYGLVQAWAKQGQAVRVVKIRPGARWWQVLLKVLFIRADYLWAGQILPIGTAVYLKHKLFKTKYFISLHGMDINLAKQNKPAVTRQILGRAELVTVNSQYTAEQIAGFDLAPERITVVYPCPHITTQVNAETKTELIQKYDLSGRRILLSVGRLVERKGFDLMIEQLPDLLAAGHKLVYVIIGTGEYYYQLEKLVARYGLTDQVLILRQVNDNELAAWYDLADIFLLPTKDLGEDVEGFGIFYLEAGLYGKPVVATPAGGAREAVQSGQTGLLVAAKDLAAAVEQLLQDESLATRLGRYAQDYIRRHYTYEQQLKKITSKLHA